MYVFLKNNVNLRDFVRLLTLRDNFALSNDSIPDYLVRKTGETMPSDSKDMLFNGVIFNILKLSENLEKLPVDIDAAKPNITREERQALQTLKNNRNIIIKKADKGGGIVIMDTSYYVDKVNECLSNPKLYKKCDIKAVKTAMNKVKTFVTNNRKYFDGKNHEGRYIKDFDYKEASFYGLPKIHKSTSIQDTMKKANNIYVKMEVPNDLSFRFITAGPVSPTSKLSEFLDLLLKPFLEVIPSYLRDATDFLNKMPHFTEEEIDDVLIVTCDVRNMYPNIHKSLGLTATRYWLENFPHLLHNRFDANFVTEALELVLDNSHFVFNDQCYNLLSGTATGTTVAPTYANLTMGFLEVDLYNKVYETYGEEVYRFVKLYWKRFLDDGQIFWRKSFGPIEDFVDILNSLDRNIQFTHESSNTGLSFLNLFLYIDNKRLLTDVYYKNTDSHDYLPFNSCHPRHIKINIPKTLARIICTIVQDPKLKLHRLAELKTWLQKAKYPPDLIDNGFYEVLQMDQLTLRTKRIRDKGQIIPFVQTHNPRNPEVYRHLLNAFNFLLSSDKYANIFQGTRLIKSERQPQNLGRLLQNSVFSRNRAIWGVKSCNQKNCRACDYLQATDSFYFHRVGTHFKIRTTFNCESRNLIYVIVCQGCEKYYIGSTGYLRGRVSGHKSDLKKVDKNMKVHKHIANCTSAISDVPFKIIPFYKCKTKTFAQRVAVENYFRRKFKPELNGY